MADTKLRILLGLTGSVATVLYAKIIEALCEHYEVDVIVTKSARHFIEGGALNEIGVNVFDDDDEWSFDGDTWTKGDKVLHIELRDQYSALVIAPCSANTLAKMVHGISDNLLTSVVRAWDFTKPLVIAPAMNTQMWEHPLTWTQLCTFQSFSANNLVVKPQSKLLACGTTGMGAMANIETIVASLREKLLWGHPLQAPLVIPVAPHPGAFAAHRNGHTHTGVDLYAEEGAQVRAVEAGVVVGMEVFTGPQDNSPWWEDTECMLIRGASGVVNYGEITCYRSLQIGSKVRRGQGIGQVKRVIRKGKERPEITGWMPSMLHLELYPWNATKASNGFEPNLLRDPTPFLLEAFPDARKVSWGT